MIKCLKNWKDSLGQPSSLNCVLINIALKSNAVQSCSSNVFEHSLDRQPRLLLSPALNTHAQRSVSDTPPNCFKSVPSRYFYEPVSDLPSKPTVSNLTQRSTGSQTQPKSWTACFCEGTVIKKHSIWVCACRPTKKQCSSMITFEGSFRIKLFIKDSSLFRKIFFSKKAFFVEHLCFGNRAFCGLYKTSINVLQKVFWKNYCYTTFV